MERKTIARIPALSFGLMYGAISAVIGLITGIIFAIFFSPIFLYASSQPGYTGPSLAPIALIFGAGAIVIFPIGMFVTGLIQGLIFAALYNFLAPTNRRNQTVFPSRTTASDNSINFPFFWARACNERQQG